MKAKTFLLVMFVFFFPLKGVFFAFSESLSPIQTDTFKILQLLQKVENIHDSLPAESMLLCKEIIEKSKKAKYPKGEAKAHILRAKVQMNLLDLIEAQKSVFSALKIYNKLNDKNGICESYHKLGIINQVVGNSGEALKCHLISYKLSMAIGDSLNMAYAINEIGDIYDERGNCAKSKEQFFNALEIFKKIDNRVGIGISYKDLGNVFLKEGKTSEAEKYYLMAFDEFQKQNNIDEVLKITNCIGSFYGEIKDYDRALQFFNQALTLSIQLKNVGRQVVAYKHLAIIYKKQKDYENALKFAEKGFLIASQKKLRKEKQQSALLLSEIYEQKGRNQEALKYLKVYSAIHDTLFNEQSTKKIDVLYKQFEIESKEKENDFLKKENNLQQTIIVSQKWKQKGLLFIVLLLILFVVGILYSYIKNKRVQKLLIQKNDLIKQQSHEILEKNRKLENHYKQLLEINREKNSIMGVVSHDLKAPLKRIEGLVKLIEIEDGSLTPTQKDSLLRIEKEVKEGVEMIKMFLDIEALESGAVTTKFQEINISELVNQAVKSYSVIAWEKQIQINLCLPPERIIAVTDKNYLTRILDNLLSNAIKFSTFGKQVFVDVILEETNILIKIKDEGPGINEEDQQRLFQKFQKLSARPTANEGSTGLGLSIVKKLTGAIGGKVWVESKEGEGASFFVEIPKELKVES